MLYVAEVIFVFYLSASFNQTDKHMLTYSEAFIDGGPFKKLADLLIQPFSYQWDNFSVLFLCSSSSLLLIRSANISGDCDRSFINLNFVKLFWNFFPLLFLS